MRVPKGAGGSRGHERPRTTRRRGTSARRFLADNACEAAERRFGQLGDSLLGSKRCVQGSWVVAGLHGPQRTLVGLHREPMVEFGARPFDLLIRPQRVGLRLQLHLGGTDRLVDDAEDHGGEQARDERRGCKRDLLERSVPREPDRRARLKPHRVALGCGHTHPVPLRRQPQPGRSVPRALPDIEHEDGRGVLALRHRRRHHERGHARAAAKVLVATDAVGSTGQAFGGSILGPRLRSGPKNVATAARLGRDRAPLVAPSCRGKHRLALLSPLGSRLVWSRKPETEDRRMHGGDQRNRRICSGKGSQYLTERAR